MELAALLCPQSPSVWDKYDFSLCFEHLVFGFGTNIFTLLLLLFNAMVTWRQANQALLKTQQGPSQFLRIHKHKIRWLNILLSFGSTLSFIDIFLLFIRVLKGGHLVYHNWLFRSSQFATWVATLIIMQYQSCYILMQNWVLCIWWFVKPFLDLPHLRTICLSSKVFFPICFKETCSYIIEVSFGVMVLILRIKNSSTTTHNRDAMSLFDALISSEGDHNSKTNYNDASSSNIWSYLMFGWVNPLMDLGLKKQLSFDDLFQLPQELDPNNCYGALSKCWVDEQRQLVDEPSLFRAICHAYGWPYLWIGILKILNDSLGFMGPLLLNTLIHSLQQGTENGQGYGYACAFGLGVVSISRAFLGTQYTFLLSKLRLQLRASIITIVYQKCLYINLAERTTFSSGEIQTLMSVDADRAVNLCSSFHDLWSLPLQMGVALFLLYTQVKFAFLAGLAVIILLIPVNRWIAQKISTANQLMMKYKDERVRKTGELLMYIRTLKMYAWEHLFADRLMATRECEVKQLATRKYLDAWCVYFWATTPTLFSFFTFGLYALLGYSLDAATVFTCLALFNSLISPLNSFPWVINGLIEAFISLKRLGRFLSCPELNSKWINKGAGQADRGGFLGNHKEQKNEDAQQMAAVIQDADYVWSNSQQEYQTPVLKQISVEIPKGWLVVVLGEVGAGKSSLLNAILGEMRLIKGKITRHGSIAYVPQASWIQSGTVRDNILFGKEYNADRYAEVIAACALDVDIGHMLGGDQAIIGEKGFNLSGGQRARLALARAVYQDCDIYLFDDTLSAVDAHVATWLLQNAIQGPLMAPKTRILCTHNTQAVRMADMVIVMEKGTIKWAGYPNETKSYSSFIPKSQEDMTNVFVEVLDPHGSNLQTMAESEIKPMFESGGNMGLCSSEDPLEIVEEESRKEGRVQYLIYRNYASFAGWPVVIAIFVATFLMQASRNGNDFWLSHWVDSTSENLENLQSTYFYLSVLCLIATCNSFFTLARAFSFCFGGLRAALYVHNLLLNKVIDAPICFFDCNPRGRILNRFSSDQYAIDDSLPFISNILLANFFSLVGTIVILCLVQWVFLLLLLPLGYIYSKLQVYYRATSRELRRLDSVSRSPIYTSFTEVLDGASTIRAFAVQSMFSSKNHEHVTLNQRASYSEIAASLWLSIRLQLLAAFVISFISSMAVISHHKGLPISSGTAGLVGLALSYAIPIISLLSDLLTSFTEAEKEMISVERVQQYMEVSPEELEGQLCVQSNWPMEGCIEFNQVTLRYMPSLPPALQAVSFTIHAGEQVGIAGRTGAGKSSVLNALFRLTPLSNGKIFIDNVDVSVIAVRELRSRLTVVPQSPFLFEGTLRENLDLCSKISDSTVWDALQKCHIKEAVTAIGGLDIHVTEGGECFSIGQRQLLCLARALLKSSKVLCLDECTANVDPQTTSLIKETVATECKGITVITIAHRISTISNMDRVLILDHGNLVEDGNPQVLLEDRDSRFSSFAQASCL